VTVSPQRGENLPLRRVTKAACALTHARNVGIIDMKQSYIRSAFPDDLPALR
jgi:hypothetical protein